jgi:hypothetical protein
MSRLCRDLVQSVPPVLVEQCVDSFLVLVNVLTWGCTDGRCHSTQLSQMSSRSLYCSEVSRLLYKGERRWCMKLPMRLKLMI